MILLVDAVRDTKDLDERGAVERPVDEPEWKREESAVCNTSAHVETHTILTLRVEYFLDFAAGTWIDTAIVEAPKHSRHQCRVGAYAWKVRPIQ